MSLQSSFFSPEYDSSQHNRKNFYRDDDTGKLIMTDNNNNKHETDIFGRKLINYLPKITGIKSGAERLKLKKITSNYYSASPSNYNTINKDNDNNNNSNINKHNISGTKQFINYTPIIDKLNGYNFYPRPISRPFINIPDYQINKETKNEINKEIINYFNEKNAQNKLKRNNKFLLSYLTNRLNENDKNRTEDHDKEKLLQLIDKGIEELREEYNNRINEMKKSPKFIALNQFKKKIIFRNKNKIILNDPPMEIQKKYQILNNIIHNNSLNNKNKNNMSNRSQKALIHKYIKDKCASSNELMKENKFKKLYLNKLLNKKNAVVGPDKLNNIFRSKDFSIGRAIKMDFGSFSYEDQDKMLSLESKNDIDEKVENEEKEEKEEKVEKEGDINNKNELNNLPRISNIPIKNNSNENLDNDTAETVSKINRNITEFIAIDEKNEKDELSFISRENENEKENKDKKKTNIKTLKSVKKNCDHERLLLEGIENETPREEIVLNQKRNVVLKDNGQLYRENLALLQLTNPIKFESMRKKDEYDMKLLIKKLGRTKKIQNEFKK